MLRLSREKRGETSYSVFLKVDIAMRAAMLKSEQQRVGMDISKQGAELENGH